MTQLSESKMRSIAAIGKPREPAARGSTRSVGIARGESRLLPTRPRSALRAAGKRRQLRHPRESGDPICQKPMDSRLRGNDGNEERHYRAKDRYPSEQSP